MRQPPPHTTIIAEIGVNHDGSLDKALELVDAATAAGADIAKFQTFRATDLASTHAPRADYQQRNLGGTESQLDMLRKLELDIDAHRILMQRCAERGIAFLSTPFDSSSLGLLTNTLGLSLLKLSSGDLTNAPFLLQVARTRRNLILSTGMSDLAEIEAALGAIAHGLLDLPEPRSSEDFKIAFHRTDGQQLLQQHVSLLHCTSEYPAPFDEVNLKAMDTLAHTFHLPVGYSDHTEGIAVSIAAVARGACIIEKHLTLDRMLPGPDHRASIEPGAFAEMVRAIRQVEQSMGNGIKQPTASETNTKAVARKSLVAARKITAGTMLCAEDIACKRPEDGLSPYHWWSIIGRVADKDYKPDDPISPDIIK